MTFTCLRRFKYFQNCYEIDHILRSFFRSEYPGTISINNYVFMENIEAADNIGNFSSTIMRWKKKEMHIFFKNATI